MSSNPPEPPLERQQLRLVDQNLRSQRPQQADPNFEDQLSQAVNESSEDQGPHDVNGDWGNEQPQHENRDVADQQPQHENRDLGDQQPQHENRDLGDQQPQHGNENFVDQPNLLNLHTIVIIFKRANAILSFLIIFISAVGHITIDFSLSNENISKSIAESTGEPLNYTYSVLIYLMLPCSIYKTFKEFRSPLINTEEWSYCDVVIYYIFTNVNHFLLDCTALLHSFELYKIFWGKAKPLFIILCILRGFVMVGSFVILFRKTRRRNQ